MDAQEKRRGPSTSLRLPASVNQLWSDMARSLSLSKTTIMVLALREFAQRRGIQEQPVEEETSDTAG